ncbi:hypothetical protein M0R45_011992 [Rubus argutus]|uniref:NAD-dependent epimerase/dehydratase domain-containing protein n=1 Tax=Rubus argutus TaxID=59490 RepID=A0AAW1YEH0_RUBAR
MRVVVTGASGFLGGRLCHELLKQGHSVRALVRPTSDLSPCLHRHPTVTVPLNSFTVTSLTTSRSCPPSPAAASFSTQPPSSSPGFLTLQLLPSQRWGIEERVASSQRDRDRRESHLHVVVFRSRIDRRSCRGRDSVP